MHVSGCERELPLHSLHTVVAARLQGCNCKPATASVQVSAGGLSSFFASSCVSVVMTIDSEVP